MFKRVFKLSSLTVFTGLVISAMPLHAGAQGGFSKSGEVDISSAALWSTIEDFDDRHEACLQAIGADADTAYEDALIWKNDGGGRRAEHCVAMALYALGHVEEAAHRIEQQANDIGTGTPQMRADRYTEAADFWLASGDSESAYRAASAALNLAPEHLAARLTRARTYAKMERWEFAQTDLTSALTYHPGNAKALRYRADARRRLGNFDGALKDIEQSMRAEPGSVESALVRGEIREAIRLHAKAADAIKTPQ